MEFAPKQSEFLLYSSQEGDVRIDVILQDENVWLSQKSMGELFGVDRSVVTKHLANIFETKELNQDSVSAKIAHTAADGKTYQTQFYNLDAIISVGYRVNSRQATQFRIWATRILREYLIKGFALDDQRLKQGGQMFGKDYFEELLERIREIRASERRFYQKITDIYAQCSIDYDATALITKEFYATVQNKLHWAITKMTAAEIVSRRADANKPNMGLTTWKNAPSGKILITDVSVAKNYLEEKELRELNRLVELYLNFAELQAERQIPMKMTDWTTRLDAFLQFNEYELLNHPGRVSHAIAKATAEKEFEKFRVVQDQSYISDFDQEVKKLATKPRDNKNDDQ